WARHHPGRVALRFLEDGEIDTGCWTYDDLDRRARQIAGALERQGVRGDRVLLVCLPGLDYVGAFYGCLYAGMVPVPAYPPDPPHLERTLAVLRGIAADAAIARAITTSSLAGLVGSLALSEVANFRGWMQCDTIDGESEPSCAELAVSPDEVAFLQYTSGSTAAPK